ncbi:hypothetical protein BT96DRAFT_1006132 [Gymnopus androsaceus JB14]|uniref:Uncharacterized protein n=1 Tax=Gymnopus androsaceus JB14 TaxID=1447944 RepID=A0A6A4GMG8_9AGAR|nr:hypothetical protein BT96DRAFT_1006132 [Gymnopus androsaceus JB14]
MPPKRTSSPSDASPRKKTKRSPSPNPSPSSPSSHRPTTVEPSMSEHRIPIVVSPLRPVSWQTATSAEIDEALKAVFQLGGHSFDVDVTDLEWRDVAKRLNRCARCEGKGEMCSAASGTELVCDACQKAHKGCSLGIAYRYRLFAIRFGAPLSWARQQFESRMARLNSRSYNSYCQPPSFFTSLEEAIQHVARPLALLVPTTPSHLPPIVLALLVADVLSNRRSSSPLLLDLMVGSPRKLGTTVLPSAAPPPSTLPPHGVRIVRGPTIRIPPPVRPVPSDRPQAPSVPLRVGDTIIPPGSDLAPKLAFSRTRRMHRLAAAETKRRLELEQQRKGKRAVKANWEEDLREQERKEKKARRHKEVWMLSNGNSGTLVPPRSSPDIISPFSQGSQPAPAAAPTTAPSPASPSVPPERSSAFSPLTVPPVPSVPAIDRWSPVPRRTWSPPRLLERPGLDGAAYSRAHLDIASGRDPAMKDLRDAYGDSQRLNPIHPVHWEPLVRSSHACIKTNDVGALQQELSDMQRRLNSSQLDLETERARNRMAVVQTRHLETQLADLRRLNSEQERMLKNPSAASAAQAKAYKALVVPGYPDPAARIEDLEGILGSRMNWSCASRRRVVVWPVDRAIRREVEIGNTSQLIHDLYWALVSIFVNVLASAEDSASSLRESNLDLVAQLGGSYSLGGVHPKTMLSFVTEVEQYRQELSQLSNAFTTSRVRSSRLFSWRRSPAGSSSWFRRSVPPSFHGRTDP